MFNVIIKVEYTINEVLRTGISPTYVMAGRGYKIIHGSTKEECAARAKDFFHKNGIVFTKELDSGTN